MNTLPVACLEITVTDACNGKCKYCFEKDHSNKSNPEIENRQIDLIVDFCKNFPKDKFGGLSILFWGGEPIINTNFMYRIIENTKDYGFVSYHIYTNGSLKNKWTEFLSKEWLSEIKDRLCVRVSMDGEPHHSIMRGMSMENPTWLMNKLHSIGCMCYSKSTVSFDLVKYLPEMWKSMEKIHMDNISVKYSPIFDTTVNSIEHFDEFKTALTEMAKLEFNFIKTRGYFLCDWFSNIQEYNRQFLSRNCLSDYWVSLHTDGYFYLCYGCTSFPWAKDIKMKNIWNIESLDEVFVKWNLGDINSECRDCEAINCFVCHSACIPNPTSYEEMIEKWHKNRNLQKNRCLFYKAIGRMNRTIHNAIKQDDISLIDTMSWEF